MQILKSLMRWAGGVRKFIGRKMRGESTTPPAQPIAFTATSANISSTDHLSIGFWNVHHNVKIGPHIAQLAFTLQKDENGRRRGVLLGLSEIGKLNLSKILADIKKLTCDNSWVLHISLSQRFACFSTVPIKSDLSEAARGWPVIISLDDPSSKTPKRCAVWFVHLRAPMMTFTPENVTAADAQILHNDIIKLEAQQGLDASLAIWPATISLTGRRQLSWPVGSVAGKVRKRGIECSSDERRWETLSARQENHGPTSAQI